MKHLINYSIFFENNSPLLQLEGNVDESLIKKIQKFSYPGLTILEISSGNAGDAHHLSELGYKVTCTG
jgi:hypothetical protein